MSTQNTNDNQKTETETAIEMAIPAQLADIQYPELYAVTERGLVVKVELTEQQKKDPLFWRVLENIKQAKIWIPISKMKHQLFDHDWISAQA